MTEIAARNLTERRGDRAVLRAVDVSARGGTFLCVLGPNGAGKSTLLRALAGLSRTSGVHIDGRPIESLSPVARARSIAWLPQTGQAVWPLPVRSVVALGRMPHGVTLDSLTERDTLRIAAAMRACDVDHLATRDITTLSGGERARALLARALAVDAPILLADEPVSALDPQHQLTVMEALRAEAHAGKIVIAVLHDLSLAARFADRIVLMHDGMIRADGPPRDVLTAATLRAIFGVETTWIETDGTPTIVPLRLSAP